MKPREQYFRFPRSLLESAAYQTLNLPERRALDRILIEHQRKSGFQNSGLAVTKRDFVAARIHPKYVAQSLRVLRDLKIVRCSRNFGGSKAGRTPSLWLLTFLPTTPTANDATHDYLEFKTMEEAKVVVGRARSHETRADRPAPGRPKKPRLRVAESPR